MSGGRLGWVEGGGGLSALVGGVKKRWEKRGPWDAQQSDSL